MRARRLRPGPARLRANRRSRASASWASALDHASPGFQDAGDLPFAHGFRAEELMPREFLKTLRDFCPRNDGVHPVGQRDLLLNFLGEQELKKLPRERAFPVRL